MFFHRAIFIFLGALLLISGSISQSLAASVTNPPAARIHWLGLKQITSDTNAAQFMKIWQLPETTALVNQTLDKLSRQAAPVTNSPAFKALRPLLNDLVDSEFYLEIYTSTNLPNSQLPSPISQFSLALRLPAARAGLWQTNFAAALQQLTGTNTVTITNANAAGWTIPPSSALPQIEFIRANDWTLIGVGLTDGLAKSELAIQLSQAVFQILLQFVRLVLKLIGFLRNFRTLFRKLV